MSKRNKIILAVVALLIGAGVVAAVTLSGRGGGPEVETATARRQALAVTVTASGKVESGVSADVFPPAPGTIETVFVEEGETVTAGARIAQMDTEQFELQVSQAQAAYSQAKAALANVDAQGNGPASIRAARAAVDAGRQSYVAAKEQADAVGDSAPSDGQIAAARAGTTAARTSYNNALATYNAAYMTSPDPSNDATVAALAAQKDGAYAALKSAQATQGQLESSDLSAARAQARAAVKQAYASWQSAKAQLEMVQNASPEAQRCAAQAAVDQAAEALSAARKTLDDATLVAPIDGIVLFNDPAAALGGAGGAAAGAGGGPAEGAAISPQAAPFTVVDLDALKFTAEVDEADIDRIDVGMKASVTLDAFAGEDIETQVTRINPAAQATATGGTIFAVEMELTGTGKNILLGMKGDATVEVSSQGAALTVPVEALFSEGGTDYVYVVEAGELDKTEITVGATTDTEIEVLEGLAENDVVALSGATQYTDGMSVRAQ